MTSTERKRRWRKLNPERSREAERVRAQARRNGYWGQVVLGEVPRPCSSRESYVKHEHSWTRMMQRLWYTSLGAGAHRLSKEDRRVRINEVYAQKLAELRSKHASIMAEIEKRFAGAQ